MFRGDNRAVFSGTIGKRRWLQFAAEREETMFSQTSNSSQVPSGRDMLFNAGGRR
jgi:hypothetical protein